MIVAVVFSASFLFLFSCVGHEGFSGAAGENLVFFFFYFFLYFKLIFFLVFLNRFYVKNNF
jgi:hypothetical protein